MFTPPQSFAHYRELALRHLSETPEHRHSRQLELTRVRRPRRRPWRRA